MSKARRKKKKRFKLLLAFCIFGGIFFGYKIVHLSRVVDEKFNVARRWNIPSRVYSDAAYLYPGMSLSQLGLKEKLVRLNYRLIPGAVKTAGDIFWGDEAIDIFLHDFAYPQETFHGFPIRIEREGDRIKSLHDLQTEESLVLVRLEPEEIATLFDAKMEDRTLITLGDIPQYLISAIILIEDERFFEHKGVDLRAIARAAVTDLLTLQLKQGGSTLTQQLVKNFFLTSEKSIMRKINEALMAMIIERSYEKAEILEAYLNEIYLGQRGPSSVTGIAEAAKHYFAKDIHQITLAEAAMLAGMIRSPSRYSPIYHKENAIARRDFVLNRLFEAGLIEEEHYVKAKQEAVVTPEPKQIPIKAPYFIDFVKTQLSTLYPEEVLQVEGLKIFTTLDMMMQGVAEQSVHETLKKIESDFVHLLPKAHKEPLQTCLISVSPQNGYVRAMVGGRGYSGSQFNRCVQAKRQPGSTIKPFVYLTALDPSLSPKIFTPATLLDDAQFTVKTPEGPWSPENYDKKEHGWVRLRDALENSYNISTAKLAMEVGLEKVVETLQKAGITSQLQPVPSLALGAFEVTPLEMVSSYTIFPNQGLRSEPISIINVMTTDGTVVEKKTLKIKRVFDAAPTALVRNLLEGVLTRGTGAGARSLGFQAPAGGKTGTTSNYRDAWFVGFTPQLLSLVWVGFDDNTPIQMSGARAALPIWVHFMSRVVFGKEDFSFPAGLVAVEVDPKTGSLASEQCNGEFKEYFLSGTEPEEVCTSRTREKIIHRTRDLSPKIPDEF